MDFWDLLALRCEGNRPLSTSAWRSAHACRRFFLSSLSPSAPRIYPTVPVLTRNAAAFDKKSNSGNDNLHPLNGLQIKSRQERQRIHLFATDQCRHGSVSAHKSRLTAQNQVPSIKYRTRSHIANHDDHLPHFVDFTCLKQTSTIRPAMQAAFAYLKPNRLRLARSVPNHHGRNSNSERQGRTRAAL